MKVSDYDYELPESSIAIYPPRDRGTTRLEVLNRRTGAITHSRYAELNRFLDDGDLLVLNNSKVVQARLFARKSSGAAVELVLLEKREERQDTVMYRGRLKPGDVLLVHGSELVVESVEGQGIARISCPGGRDVERFFAEHGQVPIPPYLRRAAEEVDRERYQTIFAEIPGSIAAPTASLNMTRELLDSLKTKGVDLAYVTLHIGLGTFLPIRGDDLDSHVMHHEYYCIAAETIRKIQDTKSNGRRVIAVGTTVTRSLEQAASGIEKHTGKDDMVGEADIFIYPGYAFKVIDGLVTNYHAPRSTVLMLAAAFAGWDNLKRAYGEALERGYRFLSYGDSMLII